MGGQIGHVEAKKWTNFEQEGKRTHTLSKL